MEINQGAKTLARPSLRDIAKVNGFGHFDLGLTDEELDFLQGLKVNKPGNYLNFDRIDRLEADSEGLITEIGNTPKDAARAANIVNRLTQNAIHDTGSETAHVDLRARVPTERFRIPNWHADPYLFQPATEDEIKIVAGLVGDLPTLFVKPKGQLRQAFDQIGDAITLANSDEEIAALRRKAVELLKNEKISTAGRGQGSVFATGAEGGIHSEPDILRSRLFLAVLPGTREQVKGLEERWKMQAKTYDSMSGQLATAQSPTY